MHLFHGYPGQSQPNAKANASTGSTVVVTSSGAPGLLQYTSHLTPLAGYLGERERGGCQIFAGATGHCPAGPCSSCTRSSCCHRERRRGSRGWGTGACRTCVWSGYEDCKIAYVLGLSPAILTLKVSPFLHLRGSLKVQDREQGYKDDLLSTRHLEQVSIISEQLTG